ncbi:GAF domain-containing protein, partial [Planktothrix sp. FACHB-1355]|uniref:trifunctional serine/threonine-protein kinase/ATP-binding protein/sensor histidine kinase n=1 Tax=Planktothrix sp. FACHB-1355 TaxID=2692854 RepID=UPI00168BDF1B
KFLHDRVQQAAYSLIPEAEKKTTHYQIGQLLLKSISESEKEERIFEIVNQINVAVELIKQPTDREKLAKLNLIAGCKAKNSTAYSAAVKYFTIGRNLLASDRWESQYNLTLALYVEAMEAAYLNTDIDDVEILAEILLQYAKTALDTIKVYAVRIMLYTSQGQLLKAINIGLTILKKLAIDLPESPTLEDIARASQETQTLMGNRKPADLLNLPEMKDPQMLAVMQILNEISVPVYLAKPNLHSFIVMTQINLSIIHGNSPISPLCYSSYGLFLCAIAGDIERGYEFGQLSLDLLSKLKNKEIESRLFFSTSYFIIHWKQHIKEALKIVENAYASGWENGSLMELGYAAYGYVFYIYYMGYELSKLEQKITDYQKILEQFNLQTQLSYTDIYLQVVLNLLGQTSSPVVLFKGTYKEQELLAKYQEIKDKTWLWNFFCNKLILCYLFAEFELAFEYIESAQSYLDGGKGTFSVPVFYFYTALTWLAVFPKLSQSEQEEILQQVAANQNSMKVWTSHNPKNHLHKYYLVEAERNRVIGQYLEAINNYELAISLAQENGYIQEEALANELAARFYLDRGKEKFAQLYMQEAYYCYARWGAKAKVADLEKRYPQLLAPILQQNRSVVSTHETIVPLGTVTSISAATSSSTSISDTLDLKAILKASQTISGEIELSKLLSSLLSIVIENAGADKCVLMLWQDDRLLIQGAITQETKPIVLQSLAIESSQDIPHKLIYKVKHNQQTVVLLDATADNTFANDPYIIRQHPQSILCSPILHQGKLLGILYLENSLAKAAFTSERVEILNLLCTQAAISLENARLYQQAQQALQDLQQAQLQIVQSEKMSALGNLVAGVAHEINNPVGFISGNVKEALTAVKDLTEFLQLYQEKFPNPGEEITKKAEELEIEYLLEDLPKMLFSMQVGCERIKGISTSLRTFSRADREYKVPFNLHEGIDSTLLILKHRLKANEQRPAIEVVTNYGNLPQIDCFPGQLNQVFMNILANAIDALEESNLGRNFAEIKAKPNQITIQTSLVDNLVEIRIADNGKGMTEAIKAKIFGHLFTTKAVGKGTGLGLAISKSIVVEKHGGSIQVNSILGSGTEFIITLPIQGR